MKVTFFFIFIFVFKLIPFAQKPAIDTSILNKWPVIEDVSISNNGMYSLYKVLNMPFNSNTLVIQANDMSWKKEYFGLSSAFFTKDSRKVIYQKKDSLFLIQLGNESSLLVAKTTSFQLSQHREWLAYRINRMSGSLDILNLLTGRKFQLNNVVDYVFSEDGKVLMFLSEQTDSSGTKQNLQWLNLNTDKIISFWQGEKASNYVFDSSCSQVAFVSETKKGEQKLCSIWYYKTGMDSSVLKVNESTAGVDSGMMISNQRPRFDKNNSSILFYLQKDANVSQSRKGVMVDVWSYNDTRLQSQQLIELDFNRKYACIIPVNGNQAFRLEQANENIVRSSTTIGNDDFIIINHRTGDNLESNWNDSSELKVFIADTKTGLRKLLRSHIKNDAEYVSLSPDCKFAVYYNVSKNNYYSYEIATEKIQNITKDIRTIWTDQENERPRPVIFGIAAWIKDRSEILIYDNFDIWLVDLKGLKTPINISNNYGKKNRVVFRIVPEEGLQNNLYIQSNSEILLTGFNKVNKENGFYQKALNTKDNPRCLSNGEYDVYHVNSQSSSSSHLLGSFTPIKAKDASIWIVRRMTVKEAPNYYLTRDFIAYSPLTNIQPQSQYNWMTSELIHWKTSDGRTAEGVLYKPENFNPKNKYPIVLNIYEKLSDRLYQFLDPAFSTGPINIPYFVSNGYMVVTPNIYYSVGMPGKSASNAIIPLVKYLSGFSWVDAKKIGIQGHSFGGYEVNYLIAQTNLFAAAASAAGPTDFISGYGLVNYGGGKSRQYVYESTQLRMGATLWQKPELYIKNSPVLLADKIVTPLLIMHNENDYAVPWTEGIEFFTALRRLKKKAWMLQYDYGQHEVEGQEAQMDYTIRMQQFFDHYLKNAPAPIWMTRGIPARLKAIETGYAYDPSGTCGLHCKICKSWNDKMAKDSIATLHEIEKRKKEEHWQ